MKNIKDLLANVDTPGYKVQGTYTSNECIFLLKDVTNEIKEVSIEEKEKLIASGINYSEMLSAEKGIEPKYQDLFVKLLNNNADNLAKFIGILAEGIYEDKGKDVVVVSLARAGTPFGVLVKDYLKFKYDLDVPHYSISIIRDKGIDENALLYILDKHPGCKIQFVDGWTGKGSITKELNKAISKFNEEYNTDISSDLAVVADPAHISKIYGTRLDIIIPNCCINSTVSGLVSRTYHNHKNIGEYDFHGAKVYNNLKEEDYSRYFLETIRNSIVSSRENLKPVFGESDWNYVNNTINKVADEFEVKDKNKIKLSIGESSRVLLRRIPRCLLIKNINNPDVQHLIEMAKDKNVPIIYYAKTEYEAISIIKE